MNTTSPFNGSSSESISSKDHDGTRKNDAGGAGTTISPQESLTMLDLDEIPIPPWNDNGNGKEHKDRHSCKDNVSFDMQWKVKNESVVRWGELIAQATITIHEQRNNCNTMDNAMQKDVSASTSETPNLPSSTRTQPPPANTPMTTSAAKIIRPKKRRRGIIATPTPTPTAATGTIKPSSTKISPMSTNINDNAKKNIGTFNLNKKLKTTNLLRLGGGGTINNNNTKQTILQSNNKEKASNQDETKSKDTAKTAIPSIVTISLSSLSSLSSSQKMTISIRANADGFISIYDIPQLRCTTDGSNIIWICGKIKQCSHPAVIGDLCAVCGQSPSETSQRIYNNRATDNVPMCSIDPNSTTPNRSNNNNNNNNNVIPRINTTASTSTNKNNQQQSLTVSGITIQISSEYAETLSSDSSKLLRSNKKLNLVLDLDHTLLHATADPRANLWKVRRQAQQQQQQQEEEKGEKQHSPVILQDVRSILLPDPEGRILKHYIKLRPHLGEFISSMMERYEITIYTAGTSTYAQKIADMIGRHVADYQRSQSHQNGSCNGEEEGDLKNKNDSGKGEETPLHYCLDEEDLIALRHEIARVEASLKEKQEYKSHKDHRNGINGDAAAPSDTTNTDTSATTIASTESKNEEMKEDPGTTEVRDDELESTPTSTESDSNDGNSDENKKAEQDTNKVTEKESNPMMSKETTDILDGTKTASSSPNTEKAVNDSNSHPRPILKSILSKKRIDATATTTKEGNEKSSSTPSTSTNSKENTSIESTESTTTTTTTTTTSSTTHRAKKKRVSFHDVSNEREIQDITQHLHELKSKLNQGEALEDEAIKLRKKIFGSRIVGRCDVTDLGRDVKSLKRVFPCGGMLAAIVDDREDVWANASNNATGRKGEPPDNMLLVQPYHWKPFKNFQDVNNAAGVDVTKQSLNSAKTTKDEDLSSYEVMMEKDERQLLWTADILKRLHDRYYDNSITEKQRDELTVPSILSTMRKNVLGENGQRAKVALSGVIPLQQQKDGYNKHTQMRPRKPAERYVEELGAEILQDVHPGTTHLIARKDGTDKVLRARQIPGCAVVELSWLMECYWSISKRDITQHLIGPPPKKAPVKLLLSGSDSSEEDDTDDDDEDFFAAFNKK